VTIQGKLNSYQFTYKRAQILKSGIPEILPGMIARDPWKKKNKGEAERRR
jgi:hypothetical protein